ncbi:major facilitator transporter [Caballeronia hypogeia]|uniref:Major facilitator transporter n=1 Tax=Caballeronia hypogeia TaxID=1777140 RepID=A0A158AEU2_9BURK|nr:MFS transporter [Caballeronia hypogeia]SAK56343.1 major facilitator transporter [Caballeronia hypogeia]
MKTKYRWVVGALLFAAGALNYLDRAAMSVAAPFIKRDLGLDDAQMGVLFSVFFVGYCVSCLLGGWCADRFGPRRVFAWAGGLWSVFCAATAGMSQFGSLLGVRALFGLGEGPMGTTINKAINNWFPRGEVGRAVGVIATGQPLGAALAAPVIGLMAVAWGWRVAFVATGVLGLIWVAIWLRLFRDSPADHPKVSTQELALIQQHRRHETHESAAISRSTRHYIFSRPVLGVALAFFSFNYVLYFLLSWLPSYLVDYQHLNVRSMAIVGALPWLGATIGLVTGGTLADLLARKIGNALFAHKLIICVGLLGAALCILAASRVTSVSFAVALIAGASLLAFLTPQTCWVLVQDIVPADRVGTAGGFVHFLANLAGIASPSVTGYIVQYGGGYTVAFAFAAGLAALGAACVMLLIRGGHDSRDEPCSQPTH